jgi:hypothetical protein
MKTLRIISILCFAAFSACGFWILLRAHTQKQLDKQLTSLTKISEVEDKIGDPSYVISAPGGWFGKGLVSASEFDDGATIRVYLIQDIPPRFLVIKVVSGNDIIEFSRIETS